MRKMLPLIDKLYTTLEQGMERVTNSRGYRILERGGKTVLRAGLRGTQKFLDLYSDRLPWYYAKAPHYLINEPHRTMIKGCGALVALGLGSFVGLRAFELMHTPEIYSALSTLVENLPTAVKFLAKEVSGPLAGFLVGSSGGYILGSFVGAGASAGLFGPESTKKDEERNNQK